MATVIPSRNLTVLSGEVDAAKCVDQAMPQTAYSSPVTFVFDFADSDVQAGVLREVVVPVGQRLRGGVYGSAKAVFTTSNAAVAEVISLLAKEHDLPIFIAPSPTEIDRATPAGDLTAGEIDTLGRLFVLSGRTTVAGTAAALASDAGIAPTAANNRLASLERKGYVLRIPRNRREGDEFLDPRTASPDTVELLQLAPSRRAPLQTAGIDTDPYDREPIVLDGAGAERAAEILRRRGHAD